MKDENGAPLRSSTGKEIIAWASQQEYAVIEFAEMDNGDLRVTPITDHHLELERECGQVPEKAKADEVQNNE